MPPPVVRSGSRAPASPPPAPPVAPPAPKAEEPPGEEKVIDMERVDREAKEATADRVAAYQAMKKVFTPIVKYAVFDLIESFKCTMDLDDETIVSILKALQEEIESE